MGTLIDSRIQAQRQSVFQKLRPVCVDLNTTILKFKAGGASVKDVLRALEAHHQVLVQDDVLEHLYVKLAEYNRVPLFEVFNEAQGLSSRCLEVAVQSFTIIISYGWRQDLNPDLGKQLLILMSLLAGGGPGKRTLPSSDELSSAAFQCMTAIIRWSAASDQGLTVFDGQPTKNVIDTIGYLLVESLSNSPADFVQVAASNTLLQIYRSIRSRVLLASLLPRTLSALVAATKTSTSARRTHKVLSTNLELLKVALEAVLADDVADPDTLTDKAEIVALDAAWLKATAPQVKTGLAQVVKLRTHERVEVRTALSEVCSAVIEDCSKTLSDSIPIMLETLVILAGNDDDPVTASNLKHFVVSRPELSEILRSSFYDWTKSLPRIMQGNDDRPKELMLARLTNSFNLVSEVAGNNLNTITMLINTILTSVTTVITKHGKETAHIQESSNELYTSLTKPLLTTSHSFEPVLFHHQSEQSSSQQLQKLVHNLQQHPAFGGITRNVVDRIPNSTEGEMLAATWLALKLLKQDGSSSFDIEDLVVDTSEKDRSLSRAYLIYDLYSFTKDHLVNPSLFSEAQGLDWKMTALSLEALVMQAQQLGTDYRTELYETLYPVLALFSSQNPTLQNHAVTALNFLAAACQYSSAKDMLIDNVDYLVNSIAWKLNTFNLSPEAPQVLNMVIRLVGASLIPYLDDLILSIFTALDTYHSHTQWVEMLFAVLKTMVDESTKNPTLAITAGKGHTPFHKKTTYPISTISGIISDLQARKKRKLNSQQSPSSNHEAEPAPHRPWTKPLDDPTYQPPPSAPSEDDNVTLESLLKEQQEQDENNPLPPPIKEQPQEEDDSTSTTPLSKSHSLLLKIAESTVPHLSSPSPHVRNLLLNLLRDISPLLARHENTFLPLINAIWPGVTTRLFADTSESNISSSSSNSSLLVHGDIEIEGSGREDGRDIDRETTYNVIAASDLIATLCVNAGDFMTGRITGILPHLIKLFKSTSRHITSSNSTSITSSLLPANNLTTQTSVRSSQSQLLRSLIPLLTTILSHVSLGLDSGDEIFELLVPLARGFGDLGESVKEALRGYNEDWLEMVLGQN